MNAALVAGADGMAAQQSVLDTIAGDLANIDTPGFRATRPEFAALVSADGDPLAAAHAAPHTLFTQGKIEATNDPDDLAIQGEGFFRVTDAKGRVRYTRAGNFTPDAGGRLTLPNGYTLDDVRLPHGTTGMTVQQDGSVMATVAGKAKPVSAGRIRLSTFIDLSDLVRESDGMFAATPGAGGEARGYAGGRGFGAIKQRFLERGNLAVVDAMMAMLAAQRAYEANAKSVQAADEMLRLANNLERG